MWVVRLALKNLMRNKRRIALSLISVIAGVSVYILGQGFNNGLGNNILRAQINSVSSHAVVQPEGYANDRISPDLDGLFSVSGDAAAWLDANSDAWTQRLISAPEAIAGPDLIRLRGITYRSERDEAVFPRTDWVVDGDVPADEGVLLGVGAANLLGLEAGDWVTLRARTVGGAVNAVEVPVNGVVTTGSPMLDGLVVFMPWAQSDMLLRHGDTASHVHIRIADRYAAESIAVAAAEAVGGPVTWATWQTETAEIMQTQEIRGQMFAMMTFALLLMAATGIANTILMAAYERVREIGTLRAMGMTRRGVIALFVVEGGLLGLLGAGIGALVGASAVYYWSLNGIDLTSMTGSKQEAMANFPMSMTMFMDFDVSVVVLAILAGATVAILASVYPAIAASKASPADAVRA